jgi:hypothetical protein
LISIQYRFKYPQKKTLIIVIIHIESFSTQGALTVRLEKALPFQPHFLPKAIDRRVCTAVPVCVPASEQLQMSAALTKDLGIQVDSKDIMLSAKHKLFPKLWDIAILAVGNDGLMQHLIIECLIKKLKNNSPQM